MRAMGATPTTYPVPCKDCGNPIRSKEERYFRWLRCRPCGLKWARENSLKVRYGITAEEVKRLDAIGGGACWICRRAPSGRPLRVDHDHSTGIVRGRLCDACNKLLGLAEDDASVLRAAAEYLERAKR